MVRPHKQIFLFTIFSWGPKLVVIADEILLWRHISLGHLNTLSRCSVTVVVSLVLSKLDSNFGVKSLLLLPAEESDVCVWAAAEANCKRLKVDVCISLSLLVSLLVTLPLFFLLIRFWFWPFLCWIKIPPGVTELWCWFRFPPPGGAALDFLSFGPVSDFSWSVLAVGGNGSTIEIGFPKGFDGFSPPTFDYNMAWLGSTKICQCKFNFTNMVRLCQAVRSINSVNYQKIYVHTIYKS